MPNASVVEFPVLNRPAVEGEFAACDLIYNLPDFPTLPETQLTLELQMQERSADLSAIADTILADLGATIQILRLAAREYQYADEHPVRMEDCIAGLGLEACFEAITAGVRVRGVRSQVVYVLWNHAREIAGICRHLAEETPVLIAPDKAYLAGLLHAMDAVPAALGWISNEMAVHPACSALKMAERWFLPSFLKDFFWELSMPDENSHWSKLMAAAHHLADRSCSGDSTCDFLIRSSE